MPRDSTINKRRTFVVITGSIAWVPGCRHEFLAEAGHESVFSIDVSSIVFGRGAIAELGDHVRALGISRVAVFTDPRVAQLSFFADALGALSGIDRAVYDGSHVEPTDA